MSKNDHIQQVIEQAKQQRAELIGSALQSHALPVALVAALSFVLLQVVVEPKTEPVPNVEVAELTVLGD